MTREDEALFFWGEHLPSPQTLSVLGPVGADLAGGLPWPKCAPGRGPPRRPAAPLIRDPPFWGPPAGELVSCPAEPQVMQAIDVEKLARATVRNQACSLWVGGVSSSLGLSPSCHH